MKEESKEANGFNS